MPSRKMLLHYPKNIYILTNALKMLCHLFQIVIILLNTLKGKLKKNQLSDIFMSLCLDILSVCPLFSPNFFNLFSLFLSLSLCTDLCQSQNSKRKLAEVHVNPLFFSSSYSINWTPISRVFIFHTHSSI